MNVSYDQVGTGEPAVVLIHGWAFGNASHLAPRFEHVRSSRRAVLLDLPGQGASDPAPAGFGFAECAAAIAAVVAGAGIGQAVLLGHSFGGWLAVERRGPSPRRPGDASRDGLGRFGRAGPGPLSGPGHPPAGIAARRPAPTGVAAARVDRPARRHRPLDDDLGSRPGEHGA